MSVAHSARIDDRDRPGSLGRSPTTLGRISVRDLCLRLQPTLLWIYAFLGSFVLIEPAPVDAFLVVIVPLFVLTGLTVHRSAAIPLVLLIVFNVGGLFALMPWLHHEPSVRFMAVSLYLAGTALFLLLIVSRQSLARLEALKQGTIWAGAAASVAGLLGFFDVAGLGEILSRYGRASGTFKDPNVLGAFVILPLVFAGQNVILRRGSFLLNSALFLTISIGGVFLSFSRGAWAHAVLSLAILLVLTFAYADRPPIRLRIALIALFGLAVMASLLAVILSIDVVRDMFLTRASLSQDYDLGEEGRFGNQLRSISDLVELPNGFGPLRFRWHYPDDPHNVVLNSFASYGWLGGFSYVALTLTTLVAGWRMVSVRMPAQMYGIAIWSVFFVQILQGFQIDTDHWRHWYVMLGLTWGLFALSQAHRARR